LVLDEVTSHLDAESEAAVQQAIERAMQGRTVILIAHRLSTVKNADRILVLQDGQIVEEGRHEELVAADTYYRRLYELQR
jgi:ABC-type multidrug transport system fused ATPase/permease subunit